MTPVGHIEIDAHEFAELADYWRRSPDITRTVLMRAMTAADLSLQAKLMTDLPQGAAGSGGGAGLAASIKTEERALADNVLGLVYTDKPYAVYVELGTKPHYPPIQPLIDWVEQKLGLHEEDGGRGVAYAIQHTIGKRGTKPQPVWSATWQAQRPKIEDLFRAAIRRIGTELARLGK